MSALKRRPRRWRGVRAFGVCVAVMGWVSTAGKEAGAAAIHRHHAHPTAALASAHVGAMPAAELHVFREWSRYLYEGPRVWRRVEHPPYTHAVKQAVLASLRTDAATNADPMVNYLMWKRRIDPRRFAHYHPRVARRLRRIAMARSSPVLAPTSSGTPTTGRSSGGSPSTHHSPGSSREYLIPPPSAPEPGMLLVAAGMTLWAFRWLRKRPPVHSSDAAGSC